MPDLTQVEPSLDQLAATANGEHELCERAGQAMIEHAIRAGEALIAAYERCGPGEWESWVDEHWRASPVYANTYMRVAYHKERVRAIAPSTLTAAKNYLRGLPGPVKSLGPGGHPQEVRDEAVALYGRGATKAEISRLLGVNHSTVCRWVDPEVAARYRERFRAATQRQREVRAARRQAAQERQLAATAKVIGGSLAEAYSLSRRLEQKIARAQTEELDAERDREKADPERRRAISAAVRKHRQMHGQIIHALALAGENHRAMHDEIVRAVGVQPARTPNAPRSR